MNRIEVLAAINLKAPEFRHTLKAVNVFTGDNWRYKTARLDAARLALMGYLPELGKTNATTFQLACGSKMQVDAVLSDKTVIARTWTQKKDSVKAETLIDPPGFAVPDVLIDPNEYFRLSERERIKFVFRLVGMENSKWDGSTIVREIEATKFEVENEAIKKQREALVDYISESDHDRHENDTSVQDWLETLLARLKADMATAAAARERMEKFSQATVELRALDEEQDSAASVDRKLKEATAKREKIMQDLAVMRRQRSDSLQLVETKARLEQRLAEADPTPKIEKLTQLIAKLSEDIRQHVSRTREATEKYAAARSEHLRTNEALLKIKADLNEALAKYEKDVKAPRCPHCGTAGKKFKDAVEKLYADRKKELDALAEKLTGQWHATKTANDYAENEHKKAVEADQEQEFRKHELAKHEMEHGAMRNALANRVEWQKQLDGLKSIAAPGSESEIGDLTATAGDIAQEIDRLNVAQKRYVAATHEAKRQDEAKQQLQETDARLVVLKEFTKTAERVQAEMVTEAFATIMHDANRFTTGILKGQLEYRNGEIGRFEGTNWIAHRSFSGTEKLLTYAGISVALARQSPIKIVFADELGRLTTDNKYKFIERMLTLAKEGFIDQAMLVDVDATPYRVMAEAQSTSDQFQLIELK